MYNICKKFPNNKFILFTSNNIIIFYERELYVFQNYLFIMYVCSLCVTTRFLRSSLFQYRLSAAATCQSFKSFVQ